MPSGALMPGFVGAVGTIRCGRTFHSPADDAGSAVIDFRSFRTSGDGFSTCTNTAPKPLAGTCSVPDGVSRPFHRSKQRAPVTAGMFAVADVSPRLTSSHSVCFASVNRLAKRPGAS